MDLLVPLQLPPYPFKITDQNGQLILFDPIRKKNIVITPEEWVRQNMLQYIIMVKEYPSSLIAVEKEIFLGELKKRCDIVVYSRSLQPWMIIECKEMNTPIDGKVLDQVLRYHISLPAKYLILTNGSYCFGFEKEGERMNEIDQFPGYP